MVLLHRTGTRCASQRKVCIFLAPFLKRATEGWYPHLIPSPSTFTYCSAFSYTPSLKFENQELNDCSSREEGLIFHLSRCSSVRDLDQIHGQIAQLGFSQNLFVAGKAIEFCCSSEHNLMAYAKDLFEQVEYPDRFLWNTMIRGFGKVRQPLKACQYYNNMRAKGERPDSFTLSFLLDICRQLGLLVLGIQIHSDAKKRGLENQVFVGNTLIYMYGMARRIEPARKIFEEIPHKDVVTWNSIVTCHVRCGFYEEALQFYMGMLQNSVIPDEASLVVALSACSALGALDFGRWINCLIDKTSLVEIVSVCNSLMDMYSKCGAIEEAYQVFSRMKLRNTISWNTMILGLAMHGHSWEALSLFTRMLREDNVIPDELTFLGALCACSHSGLVAEAKKIFYTMSVEYKVQPTIKHYGCMVDLLGRAGYVDEAYRLVVERIPVKCNVIILRTLLGACRVHGKIKLGEKVNSLLMESEQHSSDYALLANTYGSKGQWGEMARVRMSMKDASVIKQEPGSSYISILPNLVSEIV